MVGDGPYVLLSTLSGRSDHDYENAIINLNLESEKESDSYMGDGSQHQCYVSGEYQ
jgi:hypothetical protein